MSFWWVNHKQTFKEEIDGGYIWSPQTNKNGSTNQTYLNLTEVAIEDVVFSYAGGKISVVGKVLGAVRVADRPETFGNVGRQWNQLGWLVPIEWRLLNRPVVPKDHLSKIAPLLPDRHSPIQANGNGNQGCYLAAIDDTLGNTLLSIVSQSTPTIYYQLDEVDTIIEEKKINRSRITETQKEQLIKARRGQGLFRQNVEKIEKKCRVTGVTDKRLLIASHIKPWKASDNFERLDGHNGFLLSPHADKLFDQGWISFSKKGILMVSSQGISTILKRWAISPGKSVGTFTLSQQNYLDYHRDNIFKH